MSDQLPEEERIKAANELRDKELQKDMEISRAVGRYIRAQRAFEQASAEFNASCANVRDITTPGSRFVAKVDFVTYIVERDDEGFTVEKIKVLH